MRRKKLPPDTRYKWDDPDLPCYPFGDSTVMSSEQNQREAQMAMSVVTVDEYWGFDPSYNWAEEVRSKKHDRS